MMLRILRALRSVGFGGILGGGTDVMGGLAFLLTGSFIAIIIILIFHAPKIDQQIANALFGLIGGLGAMASMVASFYFGSSKSSRDQRESADATLKTMVDKVVKNGDGNIKQETR